MRPGKPSLEARAPLHERQRAQILALDDERIVEPHVRRKLLELLLRHALAVEALLQVVERRHLAVAHHQQLAVEHRVEMHAAGDIGKALADVVTRARVEARIAARRHDLHADAVPFPFGGKLGQIERRPVLVLQRVRQHQRPEHRRVRDIRLRRTPLQPGEQRLVGRGEAVPHLFHVIHLEARHIGHRRLGEPRRDTDAHGARQQLQQRPPPGRIQRIEPRFQPRPQIVAPDQREFGNDVGETWWRFPLRSDRSPPPSWGEG